MNNKSKRIFALIIDLIVIGFIYTLVHIFLNINIALGSKEIFGLDILYGFSFLFVIYWLYFFLFDVFNKGITFGKMVNKISVVSNEKRNLQYNKFLRTLLKVLSLIIFPIAGVLFVFNGFTIHDKAANSKTIIAQ